MNATLLILIGLLFQQEQTLPIVRVENDDTVIRSSCRIEIDAGHVIRDANGNGVIRIEGKNLRVVFTKGSVLRGAAAGTPGDELEGIGIVAEDCPGLRLEGLVVAGFKVGVRLSRCDDLLVQDAALSGNFRQRLRSTPEAEDVADWLSPHANDEGEWLSRYGAAFCLRSSARPELRRIKVREGQNGIVLERVVDGKIYDNDCSYLSGWGLALWRSSRNTITRNALDYCMRGYSHGVYNRGQDSAGLLMFEQCCENIIAENSITHGGDGIFGFAGREALGEGDAPEGFDHKRKGNNDNLFIANDLSYAAAHGLEMTFSFGNVVIGNRFVGNAICGVWGGYSQDTLIAGNIFEANGDRGYGLERGGVNIEHGKRNRVVGNLFKDNECGIHFWWDEDAGIARLPWAKANGVAAADNVIAGNTSKDDELFIELRQTAGTRVGGNEVEGGKTRSDRSGRARHRRSGRQLRASRVRCPR